ncbi:hypothetical protein [Legionella geestiana]|nr:hypothetical protein [Legionella geestiana]QBS12131.1 hypothetical protein E4T54_04910 [Legionella geestiana]QDQ40157.1 hypothetical protein E3226_006940 [Legionella geestiana]
MANKANFHGFSLNTKGNYDYYLLSMNRNKNVNIGSISNCFNALNVNPCEIICRKELIEQFHPIQACFIGMLAGIKTSKAG